MINYTTPIRRNVPQRIVYTYKDQDNAIIDLTPYVSCAMETKSKGGMYTSTTATIQVPATGGVVLVAAFTFPVTGCWYVQFVCLDGAGNKLYGEPINVNVVVNVDDLGLDDLLDE